MKVAIIGIGEQFRKNREIIYKYIDVIGIYDSSIVLDTFLDGYELKNISKIKDVSCDKVMICSTRYFDEIANMLKNYEVENEKIVGLDYLDPFWRIEDQNKYDRDKNLYCEMISKTQYKKFGMSENNKPHISDYRSEAGSIDEHYFLQDMVIAKRIIRNHPKEHYDVGSRIDGLISHLMVSGIEVYQFDIRPLKTYVFGDELPKLHFMQADATDLKNVKNDSIESISSCHAVEHFGLGRYGDKIDPSAWEKGIDSLQRVLKPGGFLYFSVPIGAEEKLVFNSCRIFSPITIIERFNRLELEEMILIHNFEMYSFNSEEIRACKYITYIGEYDCGLFVFKK